MRVVALITCLIALMAAMPADAQPLELTLNGTAEFGTNIHAEVALAAPGAHAVMLVGYSRGIFRLGHLAAADIASPVFAAMGNVNLSGHAYATYSIPANLPRVLTGQPLYFQALTIEPTSRVGGQMVIKLTQVEMVLLRDPASDV